MTPVKRNELLKNISEGMNQDIFFDPDKNNLIKMKKKFIDKLAKKNKQTIYECIANIIINTVEGHTEFWYLDYDDPEYKKNNYYECYHFSRDMLDELHNQSALNTRDRLVQMKDDANEINKENIVCFGKSIRFSCYAK
tara:strand:+ start:379 stop:792 length:414 start_codon:yes stop_codon:yes gene_type:complete